jgi:transcription elongation factor GreA
MNEKKIYLTEGKLEDIKLQYEELKRFKAEKIKDEASLLSNSDDPSSEYSSFQEELNNLDTKINELENVIRTANIIPFSGPEDRVDIGATVVLDSGQEKEKLIILGSLEADPEKGIISDESPLGQALLGRFQGEEVKVNEDSAYRILEVKYNKINPREL